MSHDKTKLAAEYRQHLDGQRKVIEAGLKQSIVNIGPSVVGLVAGVVTKQPWVIPLAKSISSVLAEPLSGPIAKFSTSDIANPTQTLIRNWILDSNDPVASKVRDICFDLNNKVGSPHFDMVSFLSGQLAPDTQALFWSKVGQLTANEQIKNLDLSSVTTGEGLSEAGSTLIKEGVKNALGEHYHPQIADMLVKGLNKEMKAPAKEDIAEPSSFAP